MKVKKSVFLNNKFIFELKVNTLTRIKDKYIFEYQFWRLADHFGGNKTPSNRFENKRKDISSTLHSEFKNTKAKGSLRKVDRVKNISDYELKKKYINKGIPVVLEGKAKDWVCVKKWTMDWLYKNYCDDKVSLFDAVNTEDINFDVEETTLKSVLDAMKSNDSSKYIRFNRILYEHPELINDFDWKWLYRMRNKISSGKTFQVFIGGKGSRTTLHSASEHNLFTQVYGKKHWYLYPPENDVILNPPINRSPYFYSKYDPDKPDFDAYPNAKFLQTWECELKAGDVLFNPPSWWHQVTNIDNSIGVGFRWFSPLDSFKSSFTQTLLTIMSSNPPIWTAAKNRTNFAQIFKYMKEQK